jgi:hypothetical protein
MARGSGKVVAAALWEEARMMHSNEGPTINHTPSRIRCLSRVYNKDLKTTHSWSWALLEKPPIVQLLKNFPAFYGTRRFITMFKRALHWPLSWARSIQSILLYPIYLRSILILSTHLRLGLPSSLLFSGFHQYPTCISLLSHSYYMPCPSHLPRFDHSNYTWQRIQVMKLLIKQFSPTSLQVHAVA